MFKNKIHQFLTTLKELLNLQIVLWCLINGRQGRIQDLIRGGAQIVTGLKLPFWGLSFVEFWCWGLIFGGRGARAPGAPPPGSAPGRQKCYSINRGFA